MKAEDYLKAVKKYKIRVSPILEIKSRKIALWQAGKTKVDILGTNYVGTYDFAHGATPEEAVEKLLAGKTVHKKPRRRK